MSETLRSPLATELDELLDQVHLDLSAHHAVVAGRPVTADNTLDLRDMVAATIYGAFHSDVSPSTDDITRTRREAQTEARLRAVMPHTHTLRTDVPVLGNMSENRYVLVRLDGVRVAVPRFAVLAVTGEGAGVRARLRIPAARPALSPGFFLVDGSKGRPKTPRGMLRIYVHLTEIESAVRVWQRVLTFLEERGLQYRAKVASNVAGYPRRDALVVYTDPQHHAVAMELAEQLAEVDGIGTRTSIFAHQIASGIAIAFDPIDDREGKRRLSFGYHRATVLTEGIFVFHRDSSAGSLRETVADALREANIDPYEPYCNLTEWSGLNESETATDA